MDTARDLDGHINGDIDDRGDDRGDDLRAAVYDRGREPAAGAGGRGAGSDDMTDVDAGADVGVNDAMFDLGGDERRMHVRAYNHWVSLLKGRLYPSIGNLDPGTITDFGPHSVLLDFSDADASPRIAYLGRALREECGLESTIATIADVPSRSLLSRLTDHYLQIIANRAPIGFEAEFVGNRGRTTLYRGILMPFSSSSDNIDYLFGVINWKELVDAGTQATLDAELDAAVRAAPPPPPPLPAAVPIWADGPSASFEMPFESETKAAPEAAPEAASEIVAGPDIAGEGGVIDLHPIAAPASSAEALPTGPLGEQLATARESAAQARAADARSRAALYRALGRAHDFSLSADCDTDGYVGILDGACIASQSRTAMTPIVKLVFGVDHDSMRSAEFAAVLLHARRHHVPAGGLASFLEGFGGGIKAIVDAERSAHEREV